MRPWPPEPAADPMAMVRSRAYVGLLALAAVIGAPIRPSPTSSSSWSRGPARDLRPLAYGLGFGGIPVWWPLPVLALAGVLVGRSISYLPGTGGHKPADGFKAGGAPTADQGAGVIRPRSPLCASARCSVPRRR